MAKEKWSKVLEEIKPLVSTKDIELFKSKKLNNDSLMAICNSSNSQLSKRLNEIIKEENLTKKNMLDSQAVYNILLVLKYLS